MLEVLGVAAGRVMQEKRSRIEPIATQEPRVELYT